MKNIINHIINFISILILIALFLDEGQLFFKENSLLSGVFISILLIIFIIEDILTYKNLSFFLKLNMQEVFFY